MSSVCAIVVTHNRRHLLRECLAAIAGQSRPPERILVVDNASSDGTPAMLKDDFVDVELLALSTNEGGAGGFHEGIKQAHAEGADWMWVMDDDTIPEPDALAELLAAPERLGTASPPALLASRVVWRDGRAHPMNAPWPERTRVERVIDGAERGLLPLRFATFVSLLVHRGTVDRHGLPLKNFFIWSDDVEYTSRAVLGGDLAYLVPTSVAVHKTERPHFFLSAPPDRFYYHVRNTLFIARLGGRGRRDRVVRVFILVTTVFQYLHRDPSAAAAAAILRGLRDGLTSPPAG
jgi:GT2 family glycosyltransferase